MKSSLLFGVIFGALFFISGISVRALTLAPSPIANTFDRPLIYGFGWDVPGSSVPFVFDDGSSGNCHAAGCLRANGASGLRALVWSSITNSFSLWVRSAPTVLPGDVAVTICTSSCSSDLTLPATFVADNVWHQYYFAWRQGPTFFEVCAMRDDVDPAHCSWQPTLEPPGASVQLAEFYANSTNGATYLDDLQDPPPTIPSCTVNCDSNVLFLPGIEGSRLFTSNLIGENQIWEPDSLLGNDVSKLGLTNSATADSVYTKGGALMDNAYGVFDVYSSFINKMNVMRDVGHLINDWQPIAYDWRLDYQELLDNGNETPDGKIYYHGANAATSSPYIVQELKRLAASSKTGKVTIVAHSNGGLLAKALLMQPGIANYVDKVILVASPQLGTPQAIGSLLNGFNAGLPSLGSIFLTNSDSRTLGQNMPMAYNLLPSAKYFPNSVITFDPSLASVANWQAKYADPFAPGPGVDSESGLETFMTDSARTPQALSANDLDDPIVANKNLFDSAIQTHAQLDDWIPPTGIKLITIAGWGEPTLSSMQYTEKLSGGLAPNAITYSPQFSIEGDGTVVNGSAAWTNGAPASQYWVNLHDENAAGATDFEHANILEAPSTQMLLDTLLTNGSTAFLPRYVTNTEPVDSGTPMTYFILHSPLTLGFSDQGGKYTGSTAGTTKFEVPGVRYEQFGEVQWLAVPKNLAGKVVMHGVGSGSFSLNVQEVDGDNVLATTTFAAVPSSTSTIATLTISPTQSPTSGSILNIDFNGDGKVDTILDAKQGSIVTPDTTPPEAIIEFMPNALQLLVLGIDDVSSTTVKTSLATTTITDLGGNVTMLVFGKTVTTASSLSTKLVSVTYGGTNAVATPVALLCSWSKGFTQSITYPGHFNVQANYSATTRKTTIVSSVGGSASTTQVVSGLAILKITTNKGAMTFGW